MPRGREGLHDPGENDRDVVESAVVFGGLHQMARRERKIRLQFSDNELDVGFVDQIMEPVAAKEVCRRSVPRLGRDGVVRLIRRRARG